MGRERQTDTEMEGEREREMEGERERELSNRKMNTIDIHPTVTTKT